MLFRSRVLFAAAALAGTVSPLWSQVTGTISGFVRDASSSAIPSATVTATMVEQQTSRTMQTNVEGFYNLVALPPGHYAIAFEAGGFQRQVHEDVELTVNQNVRVDATLAVGTLGTEVTVTGSAPLVDTVSPTLSALVDDRRVVDLPLNGRNVIGLAGILPGVLSVTTNQQMDDARSGPRMNVNGGRANMNMFTFDGGYFNNPSRNTGINYPPPDSIQEVRILTHNFAPEYGRNPGSQVTVVSKSGSNEYHGSAWEFLRNNALNARNFFSPTVPVVKQNQFGGGIGGPVKKDKLFFYGSYQGLRNHQQAQSVRAFVPTAAQRAGDFTGVSSTLLNPKDSITGQPFTSPMGAPCVAGNRIDPGCISPVVTKLLGYIPDYPSDSIVSLAASPLHDDTFMTRMDWNRSDKHRVFGHFYYDHTGHASPLPGGGSVPGYMSETFSQDTRQFAVNDTYTFSPTLLNQATVSFLRSNSNQVEDKIVSPSTFGMNMPQYAPSGTVTFNVGGLFTLGSGSPTQFWSNNYQFKDGVNWTRGRHQIKFGYELLHVQFRQAWIGAPSVTFSGNFTGNAYADFLLGIFDNISLNFGIRDTDASTNAHSVFFQDEFKINKRLTLTFGIRYEPFIPWVDRNDRIDTVRPYQQSKVVPDAPPGILFPGDVPRGMVRPDWNNFAPRLGFAWDVSGSGRTSVRGGYGWFYESINADSLAQENAPFAGRSNIYGGRIGDPYGSLGLTTPPVQTTGKFGCSNASQYPGYSCPLFPLPLNGLFIGPNLVTPYIQSFSLAVQQQVRPTLMIESAYAGKLGTKIELLRTYNPARFVNSPVDGKPPSAQNVNDRVLYEPGILAPNGWLLGNDVRSYYHSWQTQVTKRYAHGFSLLGSYTLSKSIDTGSSPNLGSTVPNPFNLKDYRGRSDWDRRHAFVGSWLWSPPIHFTNNLANSLIGGWTLSGITTVQSGLPLTFVMGSDVALDGTGGGSLQHAQLAPGMTLSNIVLDHPNRNAFINNFFNTAAFVPTRLVPLGTYGNAGRGLISGPALVNNDFAALKDLVLKESWRMQFRSEFFNALNQVNFSNPNVNTSSSALGRITAAASGRVIQFALKMMW
jgi:hypothetical protein